MSAFSCVRINTDAKTSALRQLRRPYHDAHVFERCGPLIVKQRHPRELGKRKRTPCFIFTCRTGCTPSLLRPAQPPSVSSSQVEEVINNTLTYRVSPPGSQPNFAAPSESPARQLADRGGLGVQSRGAPSLDCEGFKKNVVFWFLFVPKSWQKAGRTSQIEVVLSRFFIKPKITSAVAQNGSLQVCERFTGF